MLKMTMKYSVLVLSIWGFSACSTPRTIMVTQDTSRPTSRPVVNAAITRPVIKEEILLGNRVSVPRNNPVIEQRVVEETREVGSVSRNEVIERIDFPTGEYRYVKKRGRSTVSGRIYLENSHTSFKVKGKKTKLWLNPVTSYSRQWYEESYLGGYKLSKADKRLYNYLKFTYSDNSGNFNFFGLPAGDYYLTGTITCADECGFNQSKSIRLVRKVSVGNGVTRVDLMKHVP